jgi:hypothetical protein
MFWLGFVIGAIIGSIVGAIIIGLCSAAKCQDCYIQYARKEKFVI